MTISTPRNHLAETYLIAWRRLDKLPPGEQARLWLFGVARNLLLKSGRRRQVQTALVARLAAELREREVPYGAPGDERIDAVMAALAILSPGDRELITLTAWEGLTPSEIAAVTSMSANLVRVRLHRARTRLLRELSRMQPRPNSPAATSSA